MWVSLLVHLFVFFFFKQKTAYEMRISDWSSDVCSSDLLDIEAIRFPDRLITRIDIPAELMSACVPGLILQPLVENAIKYGDSRTNRPVTITIAAHEENGRLHLSVSDDGDTVPLEGDKGNGIGLANVSDRLTARFGEEVEIRWHRVQGEGFVIALSS